jgi:hypothetical protein
VVQTLRVLPDALGVGSDEEVSDLRCGPAKGTAIDDGGAGGVLVIHRSKSNRRQASSGPASLSAAPVRSSQKPVSASRVQPLARNASTAVSIR